MNSPTVTKVTQEHLSATKGFGSSNQRNLVSATKEMLLHPGPGEYDVNFADELKILDHKLSARYANRNSNTENGFNASSPRFNLDEYNKQLKNKKNPEAEVKKFLEDDTIYQERKIISELITEKLKDKECTRQSHMFKSQSSRFEEARNELQKKDKYFQAEVNNKNLYVKNSKSSYKSKKNLKPSTQVRNYY